MNRKSLGSGMAAATIVALAMVSTSALALTVFGNNSQKGSLLIYPRIDVRATVDTLITLTNDSALPVLVKCYYATSDPIATPNTQTAAQLRGTKHFEDFTINLTHNQPVAWWASTGTAYSDSRNFRGFVAPPFGNPFPDGQTRFEGELKCWAITDDGANQKNHNHLFGTASVFFLAAGGAFEYTAWTFQAISGPAEGPNGPPGVLNLNNVDYDACPNILLGNFLAGGTANNNVTRVTLASCNQDLRQAYTPTITKLTWTFFNQDEAARTGVHTCADSWFEVLMPGVFPFDNIAGLGTEVGYFRIETTADTQICGASAVTSAYVGVINRSDAVGVGDSRGTNLTGRGPAFGVIKYDPLHE